MIFITVIAYKGFPGGSVVKNLSANAGEAWRIPWTEELGGLQSMGWQKRWIPLSDRVIVYIKSTHYLLYPQISVRCIYIYM